MASDESEYVRKTQETLGVLIKKPPLTDKLLSKPPFRFLHDVIMAVIKQTGFMDGLYEGDETDAQKVNNDKDAKMAFLQKAIDIVQMANGESLAVKPAKIVAGQEANRTNEFLQALAKALSSSKKATNTDLVKRVLKGDKFDGATGDSGGSAGSNKENRDSKKKDEKDSAKSKDGKKESKERSSSKDRAASKEKTKDGSSSSTKEKSSKEKDDKKARSDSKEKTTKEKEKEKDKTRSSSKTRDGDDKKMKDDDGHKRSSSKSANTGASKPDEDDRKRRSSKSAKSTDEKKIDAKSDEKLSKRRQSSAAAKLEGSQEMVNGEKESKKRSSSSSKRDKEKDKHNEEAGGGLKFDLSSGHRHDGEITEIEHRIEDESINGMLEVERPRFASQSAKESSRMESDDQEATSSLKISGTIIRSGAARPSSAVGVRPGTAAGARPGTAARPAPPRLKRQELGASNAGESQNEPVANDQTGQAAPAVPHAPILIQNETKKQDKDDDDDDFIVEGRDGGGIDALILNEDEGETGGELDGETGEHGQLVRKILETKKELESQLKSSTTEKPLIVFDAQEREKTKKETLKLQELVQQLTRTSHPLAKIVDFLQEDVDSMLKELQQWRQEAKKDSDLLRQEVGTRTGAGVDIETLKNKLTELDQQIVEQSEAITTIRGVILNNEQRIQKMMTALAKK